MELGAVLCTPRRPTCSRCPLWSICVAAGKGTQDSIPAPKVAARRATVYSEVVVVKTRRGTLVERRPDAGMWAGLWQAPTWERSDRRARAPEIARWLGVPRVRRVDGFAHQTSHRQIQFRIWQAESPPGPVRGRVYLSRERIALLALSNPQRRILLESSGVGPR